MTAKRAGPMDTIESQALIVGDPAGTLSPARGALGWIRCAGRWVLVERVGREARFAIVRLCDACEGFARGHELRVPTACIEPCMPRDAAVLRAAAA